MAAKKTVEPKPVARARASAGATAKKSRALGEKASPKSARSKKPTSKKRTSKKLALDPRKVALTYQKLRERYPDAHCELDHESPFQLILATVLSAQSTDVMVNKITPEMFRRWPTARALADAEPAEVELALNKVGMYRQKTRNVIGLAQRLVAEHAGEVPRTLAELVKLPGVGRKTANVVLGVAFNAPEGVVVDTHVQRTSQRLGWSKHADPAKIEPDLMQIFPQSDWDMLSHTLIFHGRRTCAARKPACAACPVNAECPSAFKAEHIGRKNPGGRRRKAKAPAREARSR